MKAFTHLCFVERQKIERWLSQKKSLREIARALSRSVSTISSEITENSVREIYNARKAQHKANVKRAQSKRDCLKVAMDAELKKYVSEQITDHQSPEGISGRLKYVEQGMQYASTKAIYKFVASPHGRQIEKNLYAHAVKKKTGRKRGTSVGIDGRIFIDQRPKHVEERLEFGHFEGDFIESGRDGKGSLLVLVERKTRYPFIVYLEDRSNANVNRLVHKLLVDVPIKSLTLDNDISFQKHEALSEILEATIYFCHPQSPNEKGTVENRNKAIRRYVKKKSDLSSFPLDHFVFVENKLRTRFMTCLKFKTPEECFLAELETTKNTRVRDMMKVLETNLGVRVGG
jgi:IS30 family transposase